ncbi:MAG TPA: hypothetical protein PK926_05625 [Spirochaetota bacterium]|nr:hypothetical protein [Spirochaetota bacterium]HPI87757.1 hypothetical protein [Spirochaetota bacterium]HPR48118.1 hypothetical protein [Spirochaetota bacterium]
MKRIIIFSLVTIISLTVVSCSKKVGGGIIKNGESAMMEGWLDDNTFLIAGMGAAPVDETDPFVRKAMAKEAAIIDAQVKIIEKFIGAKVKGAAGVNNFRLTGFAAAKEIEGAIKGASIYKDQVTWDKDTQDCVAVVKVEARGLKKKVESTDIK